MKFGHLVETCAAKSFCFVCDSTTHMFSDCKKAKKKIEQDLNSETEGYNSCAQGMAEQEAGVFKQLIYSYCEQTEIMLHKKK